MHYTGEVYRHPLEAKTPLLEVTTGCSWCKCTFCAMYLHSPFAISDLNIIEEDLQEIKIIYGENLSRISLVNGDVLSLPSERIIKILELINRYFPNIKVISAQVSIRNLKHHTTESLKHMKSLHFNLFYIGIETGYDSALQFMNKGVTNADQYEQLHKLNEVEIDFAALLMIGIAGKGKSEDNVKATAKLLNETKPTMVSVITTAVVKGSKLEQLRDNGEFVEQTEREHISEEIALIKSLHLDGSIFFGSHALNMVHVSGRFGPDTEKILYRLNAALKEIPDNILDSILQRSNV